jgi:hypothetical protein
VALARNIRVGLIAAVVVAIAAGGWWYLTGGRYSDAKNSVRGQLTDPASAQFRNMRNARGTTVCGEVNAKNSFGGYIGFKRFAYVGGRAFIEGQAGAPNFAEVCGG